MVFIFSNLAISLDGKIATSSRSFFPLGTATDRKQMHILRKCADAVIMGASTLRTYQKPCSVPGAQHQPMNVIVSRELEGISPSWPFFKAKKIRRLIFVTGSMPKARFKRFSHCCEIIALNSLNLKVPIAKAVTAQLERQGMKRLLIEGGGELMWEFVRLNLINEFHVTLTPRILGGRLAPTLVEGVGFEPYQSLKLKLLLVKRVGNELYLTYKRVITS